MLVGDVRSRAPEAHEGRKRTPNRPVGRLRERLMVLGKGCQGISVIQRPPPPMGGQPPSLSLPWPEPKEGAVAQVYRAAHSWWRRPVSPRWGTHGSSPRGRFGGPPPTIFVSFAKQPAGAEPKGLGIPFSTAPCAPGEVQSCLRNFNQQSFISADLVDSAQYLPR